MLNWIWGMMIFLGTIYGIFSGNTEALSLAAMDGAKEAVSLGITMLGVLGFWCGLMEVAQKAGVLDDIIKKMRPVIHFLFPKLPKDHPALYPLSVNFAANIFGLSGAATPSGLKAMECLQEESLKKKEGEGFGIATNEMCTFLVINVSSLQLIPINVIAFRSQYGSVNPSAVIVPGILATLISTGVGILFCKFSCLIGRHR